MSNNPTSFRLAFESQIAKLPPEHQTVIRTQMNAITDLQGAIPVLKSQIDSIKAGTAGTTSTSGSSTITENITTINNTVSGGAVNDQSGATSYMTTQNDAGALVVLADASPVSVTLNNSVTVPWYCVITNQSTGLVTLTPQQNTINGNASETVPEGYFISVYFDGSKFWATTLPIGAPVNTPAIPHEWINSYSSSTGIFSQTQPGFTDISGQITTSQLPAAGLSVTITTAKLTTGGTNGSMAFLNGILTASTPAT